MVEGFTIEDYMCHIWKRSPAWRWTRARLLIAEPQSSSGRHSDEYCNAARRYLECRASGDWKPIRPAWKTVFEQALAIYERNDRTRWRLEAHLLLRKKLVGVCRKLSLDREVFKLYAKIFFDARWRLGSKAWVVRHAFGAEPTNAPDGDLEIIWKNFAYFGDERQLDLAYAVTTGLGRHEFTAEELEWAQYRVEEYRLSPFLDPVRYLQLDARLKAEKNGDHPSVYHMSERRRRRSPAMAPAGRELIVESRPFSLSSPLGERRSA